MIWLIITRLVIIIEDPIIALRNKQPSLNKAFWRILKIDKFLLFRKNG